MTAPTAPYGESPYIHGITGEGGAHLMQDAPGWIVFIHRLGLDLNQTGGFDGRKWAGQGFGVICRLQHDFSGGGTIPLPSEHARYAQRVANFVAASQGCHIWILGNEMNHEQERPVTYPIYPAYYAKLYAMTHRLVHALPGHKDDQIVVGAVAPWNNTTQYFANPSGDWIVYFEQILKEIQKNHVTPDAISIHTYTHGSAPALITSEARMGAPFENRRFHLRTYIDFMEAIPDNLRGLPVYVTEIDQDVPWLDWANGWSPGAIQEFDRWNQVPGNQQIRAVIWYRWKGDKWHMEHKTNLQADFRRAVDMRRAWRQVAQPPVAPPEVPPQQAEIVCTNCGHRMVLTVGESTGV